MTRMPLGGIRTPSVPAAATQPAAILWLYLCRSISGMATCATLAAVATLEPDTAAKHELAHTVEIGSPPGIEPNNVRSVEHTSKIQSQMRHSYAVFCLTHTNARYKKNND